MGPANQSTKRSRRRIDLIVMRPIGERTKFVDKVAVPWRLKQLDEAMLALRHKWIGAILFVALFAFARDPIALQQAGQVMRLELASTARVLRDADTASGPVTDGGRTNFLLALAGAKPTTDCIDYVEHV